MQDEREVGGLFLFWLFCCVDVMIEVYDWQFEVIGGLFVAGSGLTVYCARRSFKDGFPSY